jgi:hypothetical protein
MNLKVFFATLESKEIIIMIIIMLSGSFFVTASRKFERVEDIIDLEVNASTTTFVK